MKNYNSFINRPFHSFKIIRVQIYLRFFLFFLKSMNLYYQDPVYKCHRHIGILIFFYQNNIEKMKILIPQIKNCGFFFYLLTAQQP